MHIADIKVPQNWVKIQDLVDFGRDDFEVHEGKTYYIHNNSSFVLHALESNDVPAPDAEGTKIYAKKSGGYIKGSGDLYVASKLPDVYPYPSTISITFCDDVASEVVTPVGDYKEDRDVKGAYLYKGSVKEEKDLPESDVEVGDVYNIEATGMNVAWTGSEWDNLGSVVEIDLSPYALKADIPAKVSALENDANYATKEEMTEALSVKAEAQDVVALEAKVDANMEEVGNVISANVAMLEDSIELKADKAELEPLATKAELKEAINAVDHSTYATKEEVEAGLAPKADKTELVVGLAPKADKTELAEVKSGLEADIKKKVEATIEGANGQAKIFNETSGGGAQFVNTKKNTLSFVGVNDGNDGVFVQIYSKDQKSNVGARLNAAPTGIYYTNGKTNASYSDADEIATKADLTEAIAGVDHSTFASKEEVQAGLEVKADKAELEPLATKEELEAAIAGVDHSTFATKEDLKEGLAGKTEALIEGPNGKARIFNETSGGGAQFANTVKNTLSYVGVNDGNDGVFVQIYSKDSKTNVGARLNAAPTGIYYTNGKTNGSYEEGNEIVTKADLQEVADKADKADIEASVASVLARMNVLEERISDINKTDVEAVVIEGEVPSMNDETKDYVVKGNITAPATISGKSITMKDVQIDNLAKVVGTAQGDVDIKGMAIQGEYPESPANVILDFAADGYVTIKDTEFNVGTYNAINIGLRQPGPKGVLIDGVDFRGECRNNAISVYSTQENAVININNCYFEDVSNAVRICNSTNTSCTVNITNCRCDKWEERLQYAGLMIFEDIVSNTAEEADENNFFGNGKVVVNISNFILPNGEKLTAQDLAGICGTQDENQVFYTFAKAVRPYSEEFYPVINIL